MKLRNIALERSRGLRGPIRFDDLSGGFNVIVGTNGSGKSSLCRAVAAMLWNTKDFEGSVSATWATSDAEYEAKRESGAAPRWSSPDHNPPVPLPAERFRGCFTLSVDDFLSDRDTDVEIHREIKKELAAGFDLSLVLADRKRAGAGASAVSQRANQLVTASGKAEHVRDEHRKLLRQEQGLEERHAELEVSKSARRRVTLYQAALDLSHARETLRESEAQLAEYPEGMGALRGNEEQLLEQRRAELRAFEENLENARRSAKEARSALEETGLEQAVPAEVLNELLAREQRLRELEQDLAEASKDEARSVAELEGLRRALRVAGASERRSLCEPETSREFERLLRELESLEARVAQLEAELEVLNAEGGEIGKDGTHERGISALSKWLEAGVQANPYERLQLIATLTIGFLLVVLGIAGATSSFAFLGCGLGLLALGAWQWFGGKRDGRGSARAEFESLSIAGPTSWEANSVAKRLGELVEELEAERRQRFAQEAATQHATRLQKLHIEVGGKQTELAALCDSCGIPLDLARLGIAEVSRHLAAHTEAERGLGRAQADKQDTKSRLAQELGLANELLSHHGVAGDARDSESLRSLRDGLEKREATRRAAADQLVRARAEEERFAIQLTEHRAALETFTQGLGLSGSTGEELQTKLSLLSSWSEASERAANAKREVEALERQLEEHPELLELEAGSASRELDEIREQAERYESLWEEIQSVRSAIDKARRGHELEEAIATEETAREALLDTREELFESAAAEFLLESVARDHQDLAQPDILRRASELFGEFTHHRYELSLAPFSAEEPQAFEIQETEGGNKSLKELSSGTLSQLCLALRLSVAQSVEAGEELPLFFDEALTNSDPGRFTEVVRSLAALVEAGRQIFFLTADPADAARLAKVLEELGQPAPRHFDLDREVAGSAAADSVEVVAIPGVPAPRADETASDYAKRLDVPAIDVFASVDALHPFYLCGGDLDGLYELLRERVDSVGAACSLLEGHERVWSTERRRRFEALRSVTATWLEHYRIGRAPSVTPEVLREGPAGKTVFIDSLVEISEEHEGDAKALIDLLEMKGKNRDARLKGFKKAKLDELRADLEEHGLFTPDDPLDAESRLERCFVASESWVTQGVLQREDVVQLANALEQWVE